MTRFTLLVRHRSLKVGGLMALIATHRRVLAQQRELRPRMVERNRRRAQRLPRGISMTGIAARAKGPAVRIPMTIRALRKWDSRILHACPRRNDGRPRYVA